MPRRCRCSGALGCDEVQGSYVSAQLLGAELAEWLEDGGASNLTQQDTLEIIEALEAAEAKSRGSRADPPSANRR